MEKINKKICIIGLLFVLLISVIPVPVYAKESKSRIVKVGYVVLPGFQEGEKGKYKSGQGYEYLQKIAGYTGWTYEYVYGNFDDLLKKLSNGEIDLMGNITYTEERAKTIAYGQNEEGKEAFYLYVNGNDSEIRSSDISTINGKKIGVCKGAYQEMAWKKWCDENHIQCELVEFESEEERQEALNTGKTDGSISMLMLNRTRETENWRSVLKFDEAPYYFCVNKQKPELLEALDKAQGKILNENPFYNEELSTRYLQTDNLPAEQFGEDELKWLSSHSHHLKVGCLDGYLPLSDKDDNGKMLGVIPDLLKLVQEKYADYDFQFETVIYSEYTQMLSDLKSGKIDIATPIYGDYWNADQEQVCLTDPILSTTMLLLLEGTYVPDEVKEIGVDRKSPLQMAYAKIYYSDYEIVMYPSMDDSAKALRDGKVDAALCSACSYHVAAQNNSIMRDMNRVTLPGTVNVSMAVAKENPELMSIMNRGVSLVGETEIFNSLAMHSNVEREYSLGDYVAHNPIPVLIVGIVLFAVMVFYIIRLRSAIRKAETDPMTGLLNKVAMKEHIRDQLENGGILFMIDIDNFKTVNDVLGHKEGDQVLVLFASNLGRIFRTGDVIGRFGGDEFLVFLPRVDFSDELIAKKVNQMQQVLYNYNETVKNMSVECSVSVGVLKIKPNETINYTEAFERVDAALYEAKKKGKNTFVIYGAKEESD